MEMANVEICVPKEMKTFLMSEDMGLAYLDMDISEVEKEIDSE